MVARIFMLFSLTMNDVKRGEVVQGQARKTTAAAFVFDIAVIAYRHDQAKPGKSLWQKALQMPYGFEPRKREKPRP
jgi:hypothetical protein